MRPRLEYVFMALLFLAACERGDGPHRTATNEPTGGNTRPPVEDNHPFEPQLTDGVWRLTGPGISLRYDRGGILFISAADGSVRILDLDGATEASLSHSGMRSDSTFAAPLLSINHSSPTLKEARMMARDKTSEWIRVESADGAEWVLVIPVR